MTVSKKLKGRFRGGVPKEVKDLVGSLREGSDFDWVQSGEYFAYETESGITVLKVVESWEFDEEGKLTLHT